MRRILSTLALVAVASPLAAQVKPQGHDADPTHSVTAGTVPAGWTVRVDDKDAVRGKTASDLRFVAMGSGYHVTSGPAAVFFNAKDVASGAYTVHATFTQEKAPMHPEAYGLFVGGKNIPDSTQQYLYFIVRGDGRYMINHRAGAAVHKIVDWTPSDAVKKQDDAGKATNALAIKVTPEKVDFVVNGETVKSFTRAEMHGMSPDGIAGIRVNHNLDVHVADFGISK